MSTDRPPTSGDDAREGVRSAGLARRLLPTAVGIVALALIGFALARSPSGEVSVEGRAALGERVPEVEMPDFDGEMVRLSQFGGKPLVVNFWASWCPQCIAEMPDFERVHREYEGRVEFIGINQSDDQSSAERLAQETGVTYLLTRDPGGDVFRAFGGTGMPMTVFIAADGTVADVVTGQLTESQLKERIQGSLEG